MSTRVIRSFIAWICLVASVSAQDHPAEILDLSNWRLTLPVDTEHPGTPDEIRQPALKTFVDPKYFFVNRDKAEVVFRAHCGGQTTKGSSYPRCELREMNGSGKKRASWSTDEKNIHTMRMKVAITAAPKVKRHVVCAQIHDADDDVMMIRLEGSKLFIERNKNGDLMLDRHYQLGTPFDLKIEAGNGMIKVWYNDMLGMTWKVSKSGCYFKAGCYTQSNPSKGDDEAAYGEVTIQQLRIEHLSQ